ncbi:hypothetical protein IMSHALPRED_008915 [Imshaugia aleurites]|uniref:Uncharacterized protein n=1 Tax=Imshaugia aleurites TaxID=172621 RepID=A0A8H3G0X1_9LECA|nr:hypothetical protein IMSHALPRED_008915 [Imshaugia aleurites]
MFGFWDDEEEPPNPQPSEPTPAIYARGDIVYLRQVHYIVDGKPTYPKFWIWDTKYDPTYKQSAKDSTGCNLYLLKYGPGEKAKDMGWVEEEDVYKEPPVKEEESLIDLD